MTFEGYRYVERAPIRCSCTSTPTRGSTFAGGARRRPRPWRRSTGSRTPSPQRAPTRPSAWASRPSSPATATTSGESPPPTAARATSRGAVRRAHDAIDGSVVPAAAAGSLMFAPDITLPALREMRRRFGDRAYGRYGFADAFHPTDGWVNPDVIGIDLGITLLSAENLRTGRVWGWFMRNPEVRGALELARRASSAVCRWPSAVWFAVVGWRLPTANSKRQTRPPTADCRLQTADCGLRTADCGLRTADCGLRTISRARRATPTPRDARGIRSRVREHPAVGLDRLLACCRSPDTRWPG